MIGHSQGGMQAVKVLYHRLAGDYTAGVGLVSVTDRRRGRTCIMIL
jgi:hypothetical protein